jgi:hypothetical protein
MQNSNFSKALILVLFVFFGGVFHQTQAQISENRQEQSTRIMLVPQYLINNGFRIEIDRTLQEKNRWITYAPTIYYRDKESNSWFWNSNTHGVVGMGMDVFYRWYPSRSAKSGRAFLSAGGGYSFISRKFQGNRWEEYLENNLTYYRYDTDYWNASYHTINMRVTGGFHIIQRPHFSMDYYLGFGIKYAFVSKPENYIYYNNSDDSIFDADFRGFLIVTGLRLGIGW